MKSDKQKLTDVFRGFHEDEDGIEAIQVVMIVAVAALVMIAVMTVGQEVLDWMKEKWNDMKGKDLG